MSGPGWDRQFAESAWERQERWRATRRKRIAEGKCWQCAKPVAECRCPNIPRDRGGSGNHREDL